MPASVWPSLPFWRVSSMRRDSERISFSIDSIARRGIASVMACTYFGEFAAECRDRLLDVVGTLQRLDLARDLDQMTFQRGEIRTRRRQPAAGAIGGAVGAIGGALGVGAASAAAIAAAASAAAAGHRVRSGARRFRRSRNRTTPGSAAARGDRPGRRRARPFRLWRCLSCIWAWRAGAGFEICDSRASRREMASFNCRATLGSPRAASPRGASLRGAGLEICSICRVIESSR